MFNAISKRCLPAILAASSAAGFLGGHSVLAEEVDDEPTPADGGPSSVFQNNNASRLRFSDLDSPPGAWDIPERLRYAKDQDEVSRTYKAAPCVLCLDEWEAIDVAKAYLDAYPIKYMDLRGEVAEDFPWRGSKVIEWSRTNEEWHFGWAIGLRYFGEKPWWGISKIRYDPKRYPVQDGTTWRIWYQTGWIADWAIAKRVEEGKLPSEALTWGPQPRWEFVLVHARTGAVAPLQQGRISSYYGEPRLLRPRHFDAWRAREKAMERARLWLPEGNVAPLEEKVPKTPRFHQESGETSESDGQQHVRVSTGKCRWDEKYRADPSEARCNAAITDVN